MEEKQMDTEISEVISLAGQRAGNLYDARGLCCSESMLVMLNQGFKAGLPPETVAAMGAGFCEGMAGAGCVCGALSGASVGLGMIVGPQQKNGLGKKVFRQLVKEMHDRFRGRFQSTCCRVLTKKVKHDKKAHLANCKMLTITAAEIVTELLLEASPAMFKRVDKEFLSAIDTKITCKVKKIFGKL